MKDYRTLDRSKPYGEVHGTGVIHAYEQNNFPYDHQGNLVEEMLDSASRKRLDELEARAAADKAGEAARQKALQKAGLSDEAPTQTKEQKYAAAKAQADLQANQSPDINLMAWVRGEANYRFDQIQSEIMSTYGVHVNDEAQARARVLEEEGLD